MVTQTSTAETKRSRFQRLATGRTKKVLADLRLLRGTFNDNNEWTEGEALKILAAIDKENKRLHETAMKTAVVQEDEFSLNGAVDLEG